MYEDWFEPQDSAYATEFGWEPLPDDVIPLPRRAPDDL